MRGRGRSEVALVRWPGVQRGRGEHLGVEHQWGKGAVLGVDVALVVVVQLVVVVGGRFDWCCVLWVCEVVRYRFCGFLGLSVVCFVSMREEN